MNWSITDITAAKYLGVIEIQDHIFEIFETPEKLVFGGCTNIGFMESGYLIKDISTDESLQTLISELEAFYNGQKTSEIVYNERM